MKLLLIPFCTIFFSFLFSQDFYNRSSVQTIELFFSFSNWDEQLENAKTFGSYVLADSIRINGIVMESVGVKYKGSSSYNPKNKKNPLHIELDHFKQKQNYQGYTDIKLQNGYGDPSMIREVLSYAILEQYMDCPKSNFATLFINNTLIGLYTNSESINKKFCGENYFQNNKARIKCNPFFGKGPESNRGPDLKFVDDDTTSYYSSYMLKSEYGWSQLLDLINSLNNNFNEIEEFLDIDRALWMLAYNNVLVNLDSYNGAFRQNYYLTKDYNDRFVPTIWDLNMSFGGFPGEAATSAMNTLACLDPLSNSTSDIHPLIVKLFGNERYKKMYLAHFRTIVFEVFQSQVYLEVAHQLRNTIDTYVKVDPNKFFTYAQFQNSLNLNIEGIGPTQFIPGIEVLMNNRLEFLDTNSSYLLIPPQFVSHSVSNSNPGFGENVHFNVECADEKNVFMGYRFDERLKFSLVPMFDDGKHHDGLAGDHIYGASLPIDGVALQYYFYLENEDAGIFCPERAEHEYLSLSLNIPKCKNGNVVINEVLAKNNDFNLDLNGEDDDWIELYNVENYSVDLSGLCLSDDITDLRKFIFPKGTNIGPKERLVVWCDNEIYQKGIHTNFKLSSASEQVIFSDGFDVFDQIKWADLNSNESLIRCPDGSLFFMLSRPTPEKQNDCTKTEENNALDNQLIYSNPLQGFLHIVVDPSIKLELNILDCHGRLIGQQNIFGEAKIDIDKFEKGIYFFKIVDCKTRQSSVEKVVLF